MRCIVNGCKKNTQTNKMFIIPSSMGENGRVDPLKTKRRKAWIRALHRPDLWLESSSDIRVCSQHFLTGEPAKLNDVNHPDWIPNIRLNSGVELSLRDLRYIKRKHSIKYQPPTKKSPGSSSTNKNTPPSTIKNTRPSTKSNPQSSTISKPQLLTISKLQSSTISKPPSPTNSDSASSTDSDPLSPTNSYPEFSATCLCSSSTYRNFRRKTTSRTPSPTDSDTLTASDREFLSPTNSNPEPSTYIDSQPPINSNPRASTSYVPDNTVTKCCFCNKLDLSLPLIRCSNHSCATQWFHMACVGLDRWKCDDCK